MKRLKELRLAKGISQQKLAEVIHVTQQSVYKYENDLAEPDLDVLIRCAEYFNTSVDYLIGFTNVADRYENIDADAITVEEQRALSFYRTLSPSLQNLIQGVINETASEDVED